MPTYLFFDVGTNEFISAKSYLLNMWGYEDISTITERTDLGAIRTDDGNKVYKAEDDYGTSYYLVGNPNKNWVKFAGFTWQIIRINGNGSLRLMFRDRVGVNGGLGYKAYSSKSDYGYYVGFMYSAGTNSGFENSSNVKLILDDFYSKNLTKYDNYIDKNVGFCNDRSLFEGNGFDQNTTLFGAIKRSIPILTCPNAANDLFTVASATKGNKKLTYPIGLITKDEVDFGGLRYAANVSGGNLFKFGFNFWTMTPHSFSGGNATMIYVQESGWMTYGPVTGGGNVFPVINLKKDVTFSKGNGTISSPFEI